MSVTRRRFLVGSAGAVLAPAARPEPSVPVEAAPIPAITPPADPIRLVVDEFGYLYDPFTPLEPAPMTWREYYEEHDGWSRLSRYEKLGVLLDWTDGDGPGWDEEADDWSLDFDPDTHPMLDEDVDSEFLADRLESPYGSAYQSILEIPHELRGGFHVVDGPSPGHDFLGVRIDRASLDELNERLHAHGIEIVLEEETTRS